MAIRSKENNTGPINPNAKPLATRMREALRTFVYGPPKENRFKPKQVLQTQKSSNDNFFPGTGDKQDATTDVAVALPNTSVVQESEQSIAPIVAESKIPIEKKTIYKTEVQPPLADRDDLRVASGSIGKNKKAEVKEPSEEENRRIDQMAIAKELDSFEEIRDFYLEEDLGVWTRAQYNEWVKGHLSKKQREENERREERLAELRRASEDATKKMMEPRDWAEQREQAEDRERMRTLKRQMGDGVFRTGGDSIRRQFVPGQGWVETLRRGEEPSIIRVPGVGYVRNPRYRR